MPTKLGKSHTTIDRVTKKATTVHPYIKGFAKAELIDKYNDDKTPSTSHDPFYDDW